MKFVPISTYTPEELFFSKSTFAVKMKSGSLYDECEMFSNIGHCSTRQFWFMTGNSVHLAYIDVDSIAFEDPALDPKLSTEEPELKVYVFNGWDRKRGRGTGVVMATSIDDAAERIAKERYDILGAPDMEYLKDNIAEYTIEEFQSTGGFQTYEEN